jgi:hypothetical protein
MRIIFGFEFIESRYLLLLAPRSLPHTPYRELELLDRYQVNSDSRGIAPTGKGGGIGRRLELSIAVERLERFERPRLLIQHMTSGLEIWLKVW